MYIINRLVLDSDLVVKLCLRISWRKGALGPVLVRVSEWSKI